jgi:hypothetical protein
MASVDPRGIYDELLTRMTDAIEAYRDAQAAIDPAVTFDVRRGGFRSLQQARVPAVSVALSSIQSADETAARSQWDATASYNIDLIANGRSSGSRAGDTAAYDRLMYLIQQVLNAVYASSHVHMGYGADEIDLDWPNIQLVEPDLPGEELPLAAARIRIEVRFAYRPAEAVGTAIDTVSVATDEWSALYDL